MRELAAALAMLLRAWLGALLAAVGLALARVARLCQRLSRAVLG